MLSISQCIRIGQNRVYIEWNEDSPVVLKRSIGPRGPWEVIGDPKTRYAIDTLPYNDRTQPIWYKIDLHGKESEPVSPDYYLREAPPLHGRDKYQKRPLIRAGFSRRWEFERYLQLHGEEIVILKKRINGERCPDCYNETLDRAFTDQCPTCYGVGFVPPFAKPIAVNALVSESGEEEISGEAHLETNTLLQIQLLPYPQLRINDVVYRHSTREYLSVITFPKFERIKTEPVKQSVALARIQPSHVIYTYNLTEVERLY